MKNKLIAVLLVSLFAFSFVGCARSPILANLYTVTSNPQQAVASAVTPSNSDSSVPYAGTEEGISTPDVPNLGSTFPLSGPNIEDVPVAYVTITSTGFVPDFLTIIPGTNVVWINPYHLYHHVITSLDNSSHLQFGPVELDADASFSFQFNNVGTYPYEDIHDGFLATIIVQ